MTLISVLGSIKLGYDVYELPGNLYTTLQVGRHSNTLDIRRSYKGLSKLYHPDKNPNSIDAEEKFQAIKSAYDILMDESQRDIYNRFGDRTLDFDPRKDELKLISDMGIVYLFWILTVFVLTVPAGARASRTWMGILGVVVMVLEVCFCLTETSLPEWFPQSITEYELMFYLHSLFPCFAVALRCVAEYLYVDVDATSIAVIREINNHQKVMNAMLQQLQEVAELEKTISKEASSLEDDVRLDELQNKLLELRDGMEQASDNSSKFIEALKKCSTNPGANYYWIIFVLIYGGVYFMQ